METLEVLQPDKAPIQLKNGSDNSKNDALNHQSQRIQELMERLNNISDIRTREMAQESIQEIMSFYGKGIERILEVISENKNASLTEAYHNLIEDGFVSTLLLIHDLHPLSLEMRLNKALQKVRPYMDSHGGSVQIVGLENNIAKLRLSGSCKGCPSSASTLEFGIKQAISENCPDLLGLEIEGAPSQKLYQNGNASHAGISGWKSLEGLSELKEGDLKSIQSNGIPLLICKVNGHLYAYKNICPACELPLNTGKLERSILSCKLGHRYEVQKAGKCTDDPQIHLNPFPLLQENGIVKIAIA